MAKLWYVDYIFLSFLSYEGDNSASGFIWVFPSQQKNGILYTVAIHNVRNTT